VIEDKTWKNDDLLKLEEEKIRKKVNNKCCKDRPNQTNRRTFRAKIKADDKIRNSNNNHNNNNNSEQIKFESNYILLI